MAHKLALCGSLKPSLLRRSHWLFLFGLRNVLAFLCSFVNIRMNCHCVKICIQRLHRSLKTFRDSIFLPLQRNENLLLVWNRFIRFWVAANAEIFCQVPRLSKYFIACDGCGTVVELMPHEQEVAGSKSFQSRLLVVGHLQTVRLNIGLWLGMIDLLSHSDSLIFLFSTLSRKFFNCS